MELKDSQDSLERIIELAQGEVGIELVDDVPLAARKLHDVTPSMHPPLSLALHTLGGLKGYLEANRDRIDPNQVVIHVEGPDKVQVVSGIKGKRNERFVYATASLPTHETFPFEQFMPTEAFNVKLMTQVTDAGDRSKLVSLAGKVAMEEAITLEDDGFTQEVKTRGGVNTFGKEGVQNPVTLAPYRTFREVEQPASPFIVRFRGGQESPVAVALFEADGGVWRLAAIENVIAWLTKNLGDNYTVIG